MKTTIENEGWQLCPKCYGDGHLGRYNSPNLSDTIAPTCDVCNGKKIISISTGLPPERAKEEVSAYSEEFYSRIKNYPDLPK